MLAIAGCAGTTERAVRQDLAAVEARFASPVGAAPDLPEDKFERGPDGYVAYAMENSPQLRASFKRRQASVYRISRARRLPEPTLSFGLFVKPVEMQGEQQSAQVGLQQSFPWPAKLRAGADAASASARALEQQFVAETLMLKQRVADAYWQLWYIRKSRAVHVDHLMVLQSLSESVSVRVVAGVATLADRQQVDLTAARLEDSLRGLDEAERRAEAALRAVIGAPESTTVPTPGEPPDAALPVESAEKLASAARAHPIIASIEYMADAEDSNARVEAADRFPGFTLGVDWIIIRESDAPNTIASSKDAVMLNVGFGVPLWQRSYKDGIAAARAEADAQRAEAQAAANRTFGELEFQLSSVRDAVRRVSLFRDTLVPQAESAYESVTGAYITGQGSVVQTLSVQQDLLDLRDEFERTRADYAMSWARLEQVVGHTPARQVSAEKPATRKDLNDEGR